jgi:stage V sporulation protein SpoVS
MSNTVTIKVSNGTSASALATSILKEHSNKNPFEISCVGPFSVNQAVKGVIALNKLLSSQGKSASMIPYFGSTAEDGSIVAIKIKLEIK